jgi:hypothetical protein
MSGRIKQKVHEYDLTGKFIRSYESISDYRKLYYPTDSKDSKRPIFNHVEFNEKYNIYDHTIIFLNRPGKKLIQLIVAVHNSKYCNTVKSKPVEVLNLKNEVIAEFANRDVLLKLMPDVHQATLSRHVNGNRNDDYRGTLELRFRFKKDK